MYIQVRTADGSKTRTVEVSKVMTIERLKEVVEDVFELERTKQRLFFAGKQLVENHTLFDYSIKLNDVVILLEKADCVDSGAVKHNELNQNENLCPLPQESREESVNIRYYEVGALVDAIWDHYGAWFEGHIVNITKTLEGSLSGSDGLLYLVSFDNFPDDPPYQVTLENLRPQMHKKLNLSEIQVGHTVLVNYNIPKPDERGYWYDLLVTDVSALGPHHLKGTLFVGKERLKLEHCDVAFIEEIFEIEKSKLISEVSSNKDLNALNSHISKPDAKCRECLNNSKRRCRSCSCFVCGGKHDEHLQIICDECEQPYHISCLNPPLVSLPDGDYWYCPKCKNDGSEIVQAGESLKESKKKVKLASAKKASSKRDWGKGMACVGRTKECSIVPHNHFGPIPGVEVGTCWRFRVSASEAGVHRPQVAGIHGREGEGAFSIVLSGGYEDDIDNGDEFYYTGSGGRDLTGNKRTAKQSCDQTLSHMNLALAVNCNATINKEDGAEAINWKEGKSVRVLRNYKAAKRSKFAPALGNRYDGIYKVVKYFPQKGESGFKVWRYFLRRDDSTPAPWTKEGRQRMKDLGLEMIYPDGYEDLLEAKVDGSCTSKPRKRAVDDLSREAVYKKRKVVAYKLPERIEKLIEKDVLNQKLWEGCKLRLGDGKIAFMDEIQRQFICIVCQDLAARPVTTDCSHNICEQCLRRSFAAEVFSCPCCRYDLGPTYKISVNSNLRAILLELFPGYNSAR